ncbi:uncharacterized protein si:rp71-81e14.2 [Boleophthalmus pectinirostris]|uniref:uncharacterized protein si:rp71-81e14.2 n=1 Tax=Boleophthalmus pectinirostris TaxID=150288 RepID=UPI00242CAC52|nr:uncharacterized protein si:rp71-81e14.2 [Boleophthalmus pectinirostris]
MLLLWALICLFTFASASEVLQLTPGEILIMNCSKCVEGQRTGMYLYQYDEKVAYYHYEDNFVVYNLKDKHRIKQDGSFEKHTITIFNVTVGDSGFYRCIYVKFKERDDTCDTYRVVIKENSTQKPVVTPTATTRNTTTYAPILIIVITAVVSIIITMIFTLCVIPKVQKWMCSEESGDSHANVYEVMTRNGFRIN